jgi:hypothetical protein
LVRCVQTGDDSLAHWQQGRYTLADYVTRLQVVAKLQTATVPNASRRTMTSRKP